MRSRSAITGLLAVGFALSGCSCEEEAKVTRRIEDFSVVEGGPSVGVGSPQIESEEPQRPEFALNVPRQCDFFQQNAVRKVDILWVVDNSGSMQRSQANLALEFPKFLDALLSLDPPVDFHIGVTSTDTDNLQLVYSDERDGPSLPADRRGTSGALHGFDFGDGKRGRYLACDSSGQCNLPRQDAAGEDVASAFAQMSKVGTAGSMLERGLHAAYLALTLEENLHAETPGADDLAMGTPFVRPDAALFVVFVSDEDDSSCAPFVRLLSNGRPLSGEPCQADPGCRCEARDALTWGSADFYVRFFESYKGFGQGDQVAAGAVVCTQKETVAAQSGERGFLHLGCPDDGTGTAYWGERYVTVAAATGGSAIPIRGSFSSALESLGFAVAGLRTDFRLSRGPLTETLEVYLTEAGAASCSSDAQCSDGQVCRGAACARRVPVEARSLQGCSSGGARPALEYCRCDAGSARNILRFDLDQRPPARSSIEVCYDVNSTFDHACQ